MSDLSHVRFDLDAEAEVAVLIVDGVEYRYCYDFEAALTFYAGRKFNPHIQSMGQDPMDWMYLLWVGLLKHSPDLKLDDVYAWYSAATAETLYSGTWEAFMLGRPERGKEKEAPQNPPSA